MKSLLFKRIFQARKKRIMVYNKIRKVWVNSYNLKGVQEQGAFFLANQICWPNQGIEYVVYCLIILT